MPRLTNSTYLERHLFLAQIWEQDEPRFAVLKYVEQRAIHDYYKPAAKLTKEQLLEHRQEIAKHRPSLPARAGKAFWILIDPNTDRHRAATVGPPDAKGRRIYVTAVARPEIDMKKLARALIQVAEAMANEPIPAVPGPLEHGTSTEAPPRKGVLDR